MGTGFKNFWLLDLEYRIDDSYNVQRLSCSGYMDSLTRKHRTRGFGQRRKWLQRWLEFCRSLVQRLEQIQGMHGKNNYVCLQ